MVETKRIFSITIFLSLFLAVSDACPVQDSIPGVKKIKDVLIYKDSTYYCAFPSVVKKADGELLLAFRRAPNKVILGEEWNDHFDLNSYLVSLTSKDGENWDKTPELMYAHAFGGSQDPCLLQLKDGTLLCTSYGWTTVRADGVAHLKKPYFEAIGYYFLGGYYIKSEDGGKKWKGPFYPPGISPEIHYGAYGNKLPAYNRGALYESKDGRIFWIVVARHNNKITSNHLIVSEDKGSTWKYLGEVAKHSRISFNEASVIETPRGDIIGFLRTADFDDQAVIARSKDGGKTFKWQSMGFTGHPSNALQLPDGRVLLTYGYRHKPFGIRARILNAECTDFETAPEMVLREDGDNDDIGYTWPVQLDKNRVLVVYYFNKTEGKKYDGITYIAGTILEIK